jgi:hypothetical protein
VKADNGRAAFTGSSEKPPTEMPENPEAFGEISSALSRQHL